VGRYLFETIFFYRDLIGDFAFHVIVHHDTSSVDDKRCVHEHTTVVKLLATNWRTTKMMDNNSVVGG
jgi:hypothetical protein